MKRYALIEGYDGPTTIDAYLPGNYELIYCVQHDKRWKHVIQGEDWAGWTLDDYVIPRLASGLIFAQEIDLSHPIMKQVPEAVPEIAGVVDDYFTFKAAAS